jgi:hypothetical protein
LHYDLSVKTRDGLFEVLVLGFLCRRLAVDELSPFLLFTDDRFKFFVVQAANSALLLTGQ